MSEINEAAAQLRRVLMALPKLDDDKAHSLADLAEEVGTDEDTLLSDLRTLVERNGNEPAGFVDSVSLAVDATSVRLEAPGFFRRPMGLTATELHALELGLAALKQETPPEEHGAIDGARERLRGVIAFLPQKPPEDGPYAAHFSVGGEGRVFIHSLQNSITYRSIIEIEYQKPQDHAPSWRRVRPIGMVFASGTWYVVTLAMEQDDLRIFRLDRVRGMRDTKERFAKTDAARLTEVLRDGRVLSDETARTVRIRYHTRIARWIAEREGVKLDADGSVCVEHPLLDDEWAVRHVLQYGTEAEVVSPEEVRARVCATLRSAM